MRDFPAPLLEVRDLHHFDYPPYTRAREVGVMSAARPHSPALRSYAVHAREICPLIPHFHNLRPLIPHSIPH